MEQLGLRKRTLAATVGDYTLTRLIAENDRYQDWEAQHMRVGSDLKRIRIFPHAQKAAEAESAAKAEAPAEEAPAEAAPAAEESTDETNAG